MADRPKKVMVLGLDAPIAPRLYKYCKEGKLPALNKLLANGVWAKNAMVPFPTITPPNWTAIATGAWPCTAGITDFNIHQPGDPLDRTHGGFYSGDVQAEYVWNAIARAGRKSIVINYPTTWPPKMDNGYQIGGAGVEVNQWFWPATAFGSDIRELPPKLDDKNLFRFAQHGMDIGTPGEVPRCSLSFSRIFVTRPFQTGTAHALPFGQAGLFAPDIIKLEPASGWVNLPPHKKALQADLTVRIFAPLYKMKNPVWHMVVLDTEGNGFDRVVIGPDKNADRSFAVLAQGKWSPIIKRDFELDSGKRKAAFAMKLLTLSADAADIRLYQTPICALDGWSYPESLAAEIQSEKGLPYPEGTFAPFDLGYYGLDTLLEIENMTRQWFSDAATYLLKNKPWDFFLMHYHIPDHAWHSVSWLMDPALQKDPAELKKFQDLEFEVYRLCDQLAGDIFACCDPKETAFALISDHGAKATNGPHPPIQWILTNAGLQVRNPDRTVDWSKTKAFGQRSVYVYINVKGRDPQGIVEPGSEYREVQDRIIRALTDYVDRRTGIKPILFALRKEDARFINLYGDRIGDVVYAIDERYGAQHGAMLPTAEWSIGSVRGTMAMAGPGIKKGIELERNVWCLDLIPTLCYLAGWPIPRNAEGAILYQALEDPDPK